MPATVRYDEQYCPIARSLDVLGDRWTLLILRTLLSGDKRFTDLRDHLPGIAPTMLTQRLRTMTDQGLVAVKELPPPAARSVYSATERGRSVVPILRTLTRWGMPLLVAPGPDTHVWPWTSANAAVASYYDEVAAAGIDERYVLRIDGEEFELSSVAGGGRPKAPSAVFEASAATWFDIRQGRLGLRQAIAEGLVVATAEQAAIQNFERVFQLG